MITTDYVVSASVVTARKPVFKLFRAKDADGDMQCVMSSDLLKLLLVIGEFQLEVVTTLTICLPVV